MGLLVNGQWHDQWYETKTSGGAFQREATTCPMSLKLLDPGKMLPS